MYGDSPLPAFGPRDAALATARTGWLSRVMATFLIAGVVLAAGYWGRSLAQATPAAGRNWAEDPPSVTLTDKELTAAGVIRDYTGAVPILTFHEVSSRTAAEGAGTYTTATATFALQLATLQRAGFHSITLKQFEDFRLGRGDLPARPILITFDDGHATDYYVADKILAQYGFNAVAFLITGSLSDGSRSSYYLSVNEVKALRASGRWEFGSHTHATHYRKTVQGQEVGALESRLPLPEGGYESLDQWQTRVDADLTASQDWFRRELGQEATSFAYPFGRFGADPGPLPSSDPAIQARLRALLRTHGLTQAFAGIVSSPANAVLAGDDPLTLRRIAVRADITASDLLYIIEETLPSTLGADLFAKKWLPAKATCATTADERTVSVTNVASSFGSCRPWVNSSAWRDYGLRLTVRGVNDTTAAVVALHDGREWSVNGRIELTIATDTAWLSQATDSGVQRLASVPLGPAAAAGRRVSLAVTGDWVRAVVDGVPLPTRRVTGGHLGGPSLSVTGGPGKKVDFVGISLSGDDTRG